MPNGANASGSSTPRLKATQRRARREARPGSTVTARSDGACSGTAIEWLLDELGGRRGARHLQHVDAAAARTLHLEAKALVVEDFTASGQPTELVHDETTDRVVGLVAEPRAEVFVEVLDRRQCLD